MKRIPRALAGALASWVLAGSVASATPAAAQAAWSYTVRDVDVDGLAEARDLDVDTDRNPMRVVQGPDVAWVVPRGRELTREHAAMILHDDAPVNAGTGDLLVRGWERTDAARRDGFSMTLERGDEDRQVAGRAAEHHVLRARVERTGSLDGSRQRYDIEADFWILPGLPHGWAPFGAGSRSLPALLPRLRDALGERLDELGLVGRAVIRLELTMQENDGPPTRSARTTVFEVSDIARAERPPAPGPVVDRSVLESVERTLIEDPGPLCRSIADGELPASIDIAHEPARGPLRAHVSAACGSPELYFTMVEEDLEADPDAVCRKVDAAGSPRELAGALLTEAQRTAFLELLPDHEQTGFQHEMERYCAARDAGARAAAADGGRGAP